MWIWQPFMEKWTRGPGVRKLAERRVSWSRRFFLLYNPTKKNVCSLSAGRPSKSAWLLYQKFIIKYIRFYRALFSSKSKEIWSCLMAWSPITMLFCQLTCATYSFIPKTSHTLYHVNMFRTLCLTDFFLEWLKSCYRYEKMLVWCASNCSLLLFAIIYLAEFSCAHWSRVIYMVNESVDHWKMWPSC